MEYNQKNRDVPPFIWSEFTSQNRFGCRIQWGEKFWIAPAEYSRKKEARTMVALMACIEIFDDRFIFENLNVDPSVYKSWTKESVRKMSDEYDTNKESEVVPEPKNMPPKSEPLSSFTNVIDSSPSDRTFTALVNEECQKRRISLPGYQLFSEKCGSISKFRCRVTDFAGFPEFRSNAMPSKREAKNEIAKQIYECLKVSNNANPSSIQTELETTRLAPSNAHNFVSDLPNDIKSIIPIAMSIFSHISKECYPELSTREGIYKMVDDWNLFLEWKEHNK